MTAVVVAALIATALALRVHAADNRALRRKAQLARIDALERELKPAMVLRLGPWSAWSRWYESHPR